LEDLRLERLRRLRELQAAAAAGSGAARWYDDPAGFARDCIDWPAGEGLTGYQADILTSLHQHHRYAVRGPHGLGKTTSEAIAILWFALTREARGVDWKCVTTAGVYRQLEKYLWPEVHKWARRIRWDRLGRGLFRPGELLDMAVKLPHGEAFAASVGDPEMIEGAHADSLLFVYTEAKAIADAVFDATEGAFSGARPTGLPEAFALVQSTPGPPIGRFYDIHRRGAGLEDWTVRHVTVDEATAAGRISADWRDARRRQWGADSALYANRVLGEFHADDEDGVIPLAWLEAAHARWHAWVDAGRPGRRGIRILGLDVARGGGDKTAFAHRQGDVVLSVERHDYRDTMPIVGLAKARLENHPHSKAVVDVVGMGGPVLDRLREQDVGTVGFVAGAGSDRRDATGELGFFDLRAEAWWSLREQLDPSSGATLAIPPDDLLAGDLTAPKWRMMSNGRIRVESKDDIRKRLGRSTDTGDAVVQACWLPSWPVPGAPGDELAVWGASGRRDRELASWFDDAMA
jgi:hypothetical protein